MHIVLLISGILTILTAFVHEVLGRKEVISQMMKTDLEQPIKLVIGVAFDMVGVDFFVSGGYLIWIAIDESINGGELFVWFTTIRLFLYSIVPFFVLLYIDSSYAFKIPQIYLLLILALLALWGALLY